MTLRLALAGDTMLGRGVAERLRTDPRAALVAPEVVDAVASADLFVLNLECCISERGERLADPHKSFFFRAPPVAAERLAEPGHDGLIRAAAGAGLLVVGLSDRWREEGLGPVRHEIAGAAPAPILFVRRGLRPGALAPRTDVTQFTWSHVGAGTH